MKNIQFYMLYMVGQAMTDGVLILLHVYFMVGGGDFIKSMASIPIEKSFSVLLIWVYKGDMEGFFVVWTWEDEP